MRHVLSRVSTYIWCTVAIFLAVLMCSTIKAAVPETVTLQSIEEQLFLGVETITFLSDDPARNLEMTKQEVEALRKTIREGTELGEANYREPGDPVFVLTWTAASGVKTSTSLAYQKDKDLLFVDKSNVYRSKRDEYLKDPKLIFIYLSGAYKFRPGKGFGELVRELLEKE